MSGHVVLIISITWMFSACATPSLPVVLTYPCRTSSFGNSVSAGSLTFTNVSILGSNIPIQNLFLSSADGSATNNVSASILANTVRANIKSWPASMIAGDIAIIVDAADLTLYQYPEKLAVYISSLQISLLIIKVPGDNTFAAMLAWRYFESFQCVIPTFFTSDSYNDVVNGAQTLTLMVQLNSEIAYIHSPLILACLIIPGIALTLTLIIVCFWKIYGLWPNHRSTKNALAVCYCTITQSFFSCKNDLHLITRNNLL